MPEDSPQILPSPMKTALLLVLDLIERTMTVEAAITALVSTEKKLDLAGLKSLRTEVGAGFSMLRLQIQEQNDDSLLFGLLLDIQKIGLSSSLVRPTGF